MIVRKKVAEFIVPDLTGFEVLKINKINKGLFAPYTFKL